MARNAKEMCSNCDAWLQQGSNIGNCRAFPPTPVFVGYVQEMVSLNGAPVPKPNIESQFPIMFGTGWCRQWQSADKG